MRHPRTLAARGEGEAEYLVNVLANLFFVCGVDDEPNVEKVEEKFIDPTAPYRHAGELCAPLFILREGDLDIHAIGKQDISGRLKNWFGEEAYGWMGSRLVELSRQPLIADVEAYLLAGWAVVATIGQRYGHDQVVLASPVLITGQEVPYIYSPAGDGEPHPYNSVLFSPHQDVHAGILAIKPR